jgi:hypothetical protein
LGSAEVAKSIVKLAKSLWYDLGGRNLAEVGFR